MSTNLRSHYQKLIQNEIRQFERFRDQASRRSSSSNLEQFDQKIELLKKELDDEDTPRYHQFLQEQQDAILLQAKNSAKTKLLQETIENKEKLDAFYREENKIRRADRSLQYHMKREWDWICKQDATLPDYIRKNLETMPNNKGYIWKGIWYFGQQLTPRHDLNTTIMFERMHNEFRIHEIVKNRYHRIFLKNKSGPNTLLSETLLHSRS